MWANVMVSLDSLQCNIWCSSFTGHSSNWKGWGMGGCKTARKADNGDPIGAEFVGWWCRRDPQVEYAAGKGGWGWRRIVGGWN